MGALACNSENLGNSALLQAMAQKKVKESFQFEALPPVTLKGIDHPIKIFEVKSQIK